ncbi:MAG TPA: diguanylate cyclase, partial [Candidatus Ozemobacteraceae bacterium]|nr:diguanylate cyclase [Candidatus Ozemobacteraceae bacterium]
MNQRSEIRYPLRAKFILGIAILVGLIIGLTSLNTSRHEEDLLTQSMDQSGLLLSSTLALACQDSIIRQAYDELIPYTERVILTGEDVREISIIDADGKYLAHRQRGEGASLLGNNLSAAQYKIYNDIETPTRFSDPSWDWVEYAAPIRVGSSRFGTVALKFTFDRLAASKAVSRQRILVIALVALLIGVFIAAVMAKFITASLDRLVQTTQIVTAGDFSHRIQIETSDEIGMLAYRFNDMITTLEANQKALDRKIFEIETLFKASQTMNFQNDTDKLVKQLLEMAGQALKAERASLMLLVDQSDELATKIVLGLDEADAATLPSVTRIKSGEGVAGTVLKTGQSIIVNDGCQDPLFKSYESTASYEHKIKNLISVPLKVKDRVTGVVNIVNKMSDEGFNADDQRLMEALAHQAAMAVEHARLYELAITDGLTKLYIHRYFQARLDEEIMRAKRYHTTVSLILFDIDHFKIFNDTYGHQQGDIVLVETARLMKQAVRDTVDIPARYGGEEFVIILPETDAKGAQLVAERLRKTIEAFEYPGQGKALKVTISLGIASFPDHASTKP